ncbi:hypothetical protein BLS_000235 [Venturia inaequalis]|uniref:DUF3074 domain-containing protein n=1 Tax=Venturia inaequalis TaxID=5025 RepID=A0A8H3Z8J7_VENIN|nr:hypothetical protein BLS_000235 [Venturia inaequalis]KAE9989559.1 hypothetical protein EG327_002563 [Venturia inaequalis]
MSKLHDALSSLSPTDWDSVPRDDTLPRFLKQTFSDAELICNSIPSPPGGTDFLSSAPHPSVGNASSAAEIIHSDARAAPPAPDHASLQKSWGKPLKIAVKDNPLGITMYKMAGNDRHGAWFARRSVHEGLGFTKWKRAMQKEFGQSLAINGGPGEGSVRGIGADRRLEQKVVEGVGSLEVFQLSAQFPGPVAPREFITCLMTTDTGLTEKSAAHGEGTSDSKVVPRHWMVVSVPIDHPEAPARQGLVRGSYESVEMIREIPLNPSKSKSTPNLPNTDGSSERGRARGSTIGYAESRGESAKGERMDNHGVAANDPESNPVEWIMVTRSDPGGGIPRFMVERGTPASITADAAKFLDWATTIEDTPDIEEAPRPSQEGVAQQQPEQQIKRRSTEYSAAAGNGHLAGVSPQATRSESTFEPSNPSHTGVIASLTSAVQSGIEMYAPMVVQNNLPEFMHPSSRRGYDSDTSSSDDSFESFENTIDYKTAHEGPRSPDPLASESDLSMFPDDSSGITEKGLERRGTETSEHVRYEKELAKLTAKRKRLDDKMEKVREDEAKRTKELSEKDDKDVEKTKEKIEKEKKKQEGKYEKELKKLEQKKEKEAKRLENRQRKHRDKDQLSRVTRERNEYRRQVEILRRENELLHLQLGDSQNQTTLLVQKLGKTGGGNDILNAVREETKGGRNRASSVDTKTSRRSGESAVASSKLIQELKD